MSDIIDEITFEGYGLDTDSSEKYMLPGNSNYALNILKGEDGVYGEITNLKGNRKITYTPPNNHPWKGCNVYFTLSSCYDPLTRNVYYWVFSQPIDVTGSGDYEYDNRLLRFNEDTEVIDTVFCDDKNYFGLDPAKPFKDSFILGDWLYFNPRESEPKMIHITMAYNYTNYLAYDSTLTYNYGDKRTYFGGLFLALEAIAVGETPVSAHAKWERIDDCYQYESADPSIDSEFRYAFNVIKRPPLNRPRCAYRSDENVLSNHVKKIMFQFSYRYQYFDDSYSLFSALSDVTLPPHGEYYNGDVPNEPSLYNCIAVTVDLHSSATVKRVEIVFKDAGGSEVWKRAEVIDRQDRALLGQPSQVYLFYNNEAYFTVPNLKIETIPHDAVPVKANCQEIINKNILCYGGCTEGFNNLNKEDIYVNLTAEIVALTIPNSFNTVKRNNLWTVSQIEGVTIPRKYYYGDWKWKSEYHQTVGSGFSFFINKWIFSFDWYSPGLLAVDDIYTITIGGVTTDYTIVLADTLSEQTLITNLRSFFQTYYPAIVVVWPNIVADGTGHFYLDFGQEAHIVTQSIFHTPSGSLVSTLSKERGFKTGSWHPFCLFYYDQSLRRWDAQVSRENIDDVATAWRVEGTTAYVPTLNEYSPIGDTTAYKFNIAWEIYHLPPVGAKYWRWGYAGNSLCGTNFVQYIVNEIGASDPAIEEPLNTWFIDISPLQTLIQPTDASWNQFPNSVIKPYEWQEGDRIRFITEGLADPDTAIGNLIDGMYDMEILRQDKATNRIYVQKQDFVPADHSIGERSLVEIYHPTKDSPEPVYYEFGELMPIIEDSGGVLCHGINPASSGIQNQDWSTDTPATGVFTNGDIYHIVRTPSRPINLVEGFFHESNGYSDFYQSDNYDKGKQGWESDFEQRKLNIVRYSKPYLQNTRINGLSTFAGGDLKELNDVFGDILRIIEIGDTLKVYQRKKPSSILIGRTEYTDAEGNNNVVSVASSVLGSIRYSSTNYGTEFPESISRNNRFVYGFDPYNGVMWRDSPNGIFPISGKFESAQGSGSYRMETWFKGKAKALLVSGIEHCNVLTAWDENHKNLYVIFKDAVEEANDAAIMFHEPSNRWICFTDMGYTPVEGWDQILELTYETLWGFEAGIGYEFDEDTRFAFFNIGAPASGDPGGGTTPNIRAFPSAVKLELVPYAPAVSTEETATPDVVNLELVPYAPDVYMHWVDATVINFSWDWDKYGIANKIDSVFDIGDGYEISLGAGYGGMALITFIPTWITLRDSSGQELSAGEYIYYGNYVTDGDTISVYPNELESIGKNTGMARSEQVIFTDEKGCTVVFTVYQDGAPDAPAVYFSDDGTFTMSGSSYEVTVGDSFITVSFNHDLTEDTWKTFRVFDSTLVNVLYNGVGESYGILLAADGSATKTVYLTGHPVVAGDVLTVAIGDFTV